MAIKFRPVEGGLSGVHEDYGRSAGEDVGGAPSDLFSIDPASISGTTEPGTGTDNAAEPGTGADSATGKRPRRKRADTGVVRAPRVKRAASQLDLSGFAPFLAFSTGMLAHNAQIPELGIQAEEAQQLLVAAGDVAQHYDIPAVSKKTIAWANLGSIAATIIAGHYGAYKARMRSEAAAFLHHQQYEGITA
jgi:hypothetical protein